MKSTGIVRHMDDLGRIVIPKEMRKTLGMKERDPVEFFVEEERVVMQKYYRGGTLQSLADKYIDFLKEESEAAITICDTERVLSSEGIHITKGKKLSQSLIDRITSADPYIIQQKYPVMFYPADGEEYRLVDCVPIYAFCDIIGAICFWEKSSEHELVMINRELSKDVAMFLGRSYERIKSE